MDMEDLINECGGFGKFQIIVVLGITAHAMSFGWSMLQMSYAGFVPDWHCVLGSNMDNSSYYTNETLKECSLNNSYTGYHDKECQSYHFEGSAKTVINEWDLVCDRSWVKATITSIQMTGVLVGAVLSGQLASLIGRKKTYFGASLIHAFLNIGAAFSTSWEMFAVFRFLLGICIGSMVVVINPYPMEFVTEKWRPLPPLLPTWAMGVSVFATAAYFLDNWSYLHIACGVFNLALMISYIYVPESVRWLTLKGRYEEAEKIVERMAMVNGKEPPKQTRAVLEKIFKDEQESRSNGRNYTYLDLFKDKKQIIKTLILTYQWFTLASVYYGMSFGVSALSGNLYLNIFLLTVVELPLQFSTFYFLNKFGRKRTAIYLNFVGVIPACCCWIMFSVVDADSRGSWITGLSMVAKMGLGAAWGAVSVWTGESYPTVIRSLGFGTVHMGARIGTIVAPFAMDFDNRPMIAYAVITSLVVGAIILALFIPDTKGQQLADSINNNTSKGDKSDTKLSTIGEHQNNDKKSNDFVRPESCTKEDIIRNGGNIQQASFGETVDHRF